MTDRQHPTPAAVYARVSSDRQDVDLSVAAQLRALREYAERNGFIIVRQYVDEAESGRVADRPQFRRMIDEGSSTLAPLDCWTMWRKGSDSRRPVPATHSRQSASSPQSGRRTASEQRGIQPFGFPCSG